jgi:hypothetical protein
VNKINVGVGIMGIVGVALMVLAGCAASGPTHQSAPNPAEINHQAANAIVEMPDGFRNVAEKCDSGGNMILVSSRGELLDNNSGGALPSAVAVILNDPRCKR